MSYSRQHVVIDFPSILDFITYILDKHTSPSIIVICATKEDFVENLLDHFNQSSAGSFQGPDMTGSEHPLLIPTLHLLSKSCTIQLAYTPTLQHLRAYLATYTPKRTTSNEHPVHDRPGTYEPILALLNPLALHRSTSEFSAQGLSRTFAIAVEAAARANMQLLVTECKSVPEDDPMQSNENEVSQTDTDPWAERVSLLSDSIRSAGDDRIWAGRTVEVGKIISRWCRFMTVTSDSQEE